MINTFFYDVINMFHVFLITYDTTGSKLICYIVQIKYNEGHTFIKSNFFTNN